MRRTSILALAITLGALPLQAQRNSDLDDGHWMENCRDSWGDRDRGRACEVRDVPTKIDGHALEVDGRENGGIRVVAWDGSSVKVTARLQASGRNDADAHDVLKDVRIELEGNRLHANGPRSGGNWRDRESWSVSYVIMVPRRFDLTLDANNGALNVTGVTGKLDLRTMNGSVNISDVGGDVHARTQNGSLNVELAGTKWDGTGLSAETQNGSVRMSIPARYAATIETGTVNGHVNTDFPVTVSGRISRQMSLPLNGGGTTLRATTTNGSVTLSQR